MTIGGPHEAKEFQSSQEHRRDLDWIEENRAIFWLVATVACEQTGPGAIVVDLSKPSNDGGYLFRYMTQGEIELKDNHLDRQLREYNPHREFVVVLLKTNDQIRIHLGDAPLIGWWDSMTTNIPYSD
jgi:hypothetical protein